MATRSDDEMTLDERPPSFDASSALERFRARASAEGIAHRPSLIAALTARLGLATSSWLRAAAVTAAALLVATGLTVSGVAETLLTIFEPRQVATVRFDPTDLSGVPDPSAYGTLTWLEQPTSAQAADATSAVAIAGFRPLVPSALPQGVPTAARFSVMSRGRATFQFDEAKAREAAEKVGRTAPAMPASIAATTLTMTGGPAILQMYGAAPNAPSSTSPWGGNPPILIVQARAPVVTSNGATVEELRDYALAQPGIPAALAAQIRAIGDPVGTLLIPLSLNASDARSVNVQGVQGLLFGDNTGLGSGVVWLKDGFVHVILGSVTEADLLSLAASLR